MILYMHKQLKGGRQGRFLTGVLELQRDLGQAASDSLRRCFRHHDARHGACENEGELGVGLALGAQELLRRVLSELLVHETWTGKHAVQVRSSADREGTHAS